MKRQDAKRIGLITAVVLSATLFWGASKPWLASPLRFEDWTVILWPLLAAILLAGVAGVAFMLLRGRWDRIAVICASWATILLFFPPSLWYVSVLPIFFVLWYWAAVRMQMDLRDRTRIRPNVTLGTALKLILLGAFLLISMAFYLQVVELESDTAVVKRVVSGSVSLVYDNTSVARELERLPGFAQGSVKEEFTARAEAWVQEWLGPWAFLTPPILAFSLFFVLWALAFIPREFGIWLGSALFTRLRRTGFVVIERTPADAERVTLG